MTLVAVLFANEFPLVITDSLLSQPDPEDYGTLSPLMESVDQRQGNGFKPVGLTRKFWILPDKTLFFYCGTIGTAQAFFDLLGDRMQRGEMLTRGLMIEVRDEMDQRMKPFSCITLSPPKVQDAQSEPLEFRAHTVEALGNFVEVDIAGYGYVLAIGTGAEPLLKLLKNSPRPPDGSEANKVLAALNAAARATLNYRSSESGLAGASSGGYFEVLMPWLFEKSFHWLMRGAAHVFLDICDARTRLERLVVAQQLEDQTVVLAGTDCRAVVMSERIVFSTDEMYNVAIDGDRTKLAKFTKNVTIPISHISVATFYGRRKFSCGHLAHAHTVSYGGDGPVATLMEDDDDFDRPDDLPPLLCFEDYSKGILTLKTRLQASKCPCCK